MDSEDDDCFADIETDIFKVIQNTQTIKKNEPNNSHLSVLRKTFGHSDFRSMQWKVISTVLEEKKDCLSIMSTGYGKSLCYQFPAVFTSKTTLVVSPLISLMEDQVLSMNVSNIPACYLGSAQTDRTVSSRALNGEFRIVYVTPEFITCEEGINFLQKLESKLVLIGIDEAHCVSQWGHDFRPAYRKLNTIRKYVPNVPILAVTATATLHVRTDIISSLMLKYPLVLCTGFDRPNLEFHIRLKGEFGIWSDLKPLLNSNTSNGSVIIYCLTRKDADSYAELLNIHGVKCLAYHAGLSLKTRKDVHEKFAKDKVQVIVATIAFGMGIDKPDVRLVIHYGASKDLESYYQEVGRAGRDGLPSMCFMFYSRSDFGLHKRLRELSYKSDSLLKNLENLSNKMLNYIESRECRRLVILRYFEGPDAKCIPHKKCCDNCKKERSALKESEKYVDIDDQGMFDFTQDARILLEALILFHKSGLGIVLLLIKGSRNQKINSSLYKSKSYGAGKHKTDEWWKSLSLLLQREDLLKTETINNSTFKYQVTVITDKGRTFLRDTSQILKLKPSEDMYRHLKIIKPTYLYDTNPSTSTDLKTKLIEFKADPTDDLVRALLKIRTQLASESNIMPYMVASNSALHQMAQIKPVNLDQMRNAKFDGFSDAIISKFGQKFLNCILENRNYKQLSIRDALNNSMEAEIKKETDLLWENDDDICYDDMDFEVTQQKTPPPPKLVRENKIIPSQKISYDDDDDENDNPVDSEMFNTQTLENNLLKLCEKEDEKRTPPKTVTTPRKIIIHNKIVATKRIVYEDSDSDEETVTRSPVKRVIPNWLRTISPPASKRPSQTSPGGSKAIFKAKSNLF